MKSRLTRLLVPLDGSALAEAALPTARLLARASGARVVLLHVVERHVKNAIHGDRHLVDTDAAESYLRQIASSWFTFGAKVDIHVHAEPAADLAASIAEHETELDHDLVVMCTHGSGGAQRAFVGSVAQRVIEHGDRPVLIVRSSRKQPAVRPDDARPLELDPILVPVDENPEHRTVLDFAEVIAGTLGSRMHLLRIVPTYSTLPGKMSAVGRMLPGTVSRMLDASVESGAHDIEALIEKFRSAGIETTGRIVRGDAARVILKAGREMASGLIVLGTHGRTQFNAFWQGSVGGRVTGRCRCPLLLVPVGKTAGEAE